MNESRRAGRAVRSRAVIVGEGPAVGDLRRAVRHDVLIQVANLFEALGEVTTASASNPIAAVILSSGLLKSISSDALEAIRRLDPAVQVLVLREPGDTIGQEWSSAIDATIDHPTADALNGVLNLELFTPYSDVPEAPSVDTDAAPHGIASPDADLPETDCRETGTTGTASGTLTPPPPEKMPSVPLPPEVLFSETPSSNPVEGHAELGDIDLVDALLREPAGIAERAMAILRAHTGWTDAVFIPAQDAEGDNAAERSVAVEHHSRHLGWLNTTATDRGGVARWADWLGHWMMLDETFRSYRVMAFQDQLTGAWNRRFFFAFLDQSLDEARRYRRPVTVMVFDIDDFKQYNDRFGHAAGDEILIETVRLLRSVIRKGDRVCRIGGDEFAVIFADREAPREPGSSHPASVEAMARRFQDQIAQTRFPKLGLEAPGTLSISGGLATYPWDGTDGQTLLDHADQLALRSKRKGKNAFTFGPG